MSTESISNLRKRFEDEFSSNPDLYHPVDIERVRTEEFQVKRFLLEHENDENKAFEGLKTTLKWKKEFGLHERDDQYFPKEMWELNQIDLNGTDREGHVVQWALQRNLYSFKEMALLDKQFNAHVMERLDRAGGEKGYSLVVDTNGSGLSSVDMDLSKFKVALLDHYPQNCRAMFFVDLPWLLSSVLKLIVSFMSPKVRHLVMYVKRQELTKHIDPEYIPSEIGGKREKHNFPQGTIPLDQMQQKFGFSDKFIDQYYNHYKIPRTNK